MYESTLFTLGLIFLGALCIGIGVWLQDKERDKRLAQETRKALAIKKAIQDDAARQQSSSAKSSSSLLGTAAKVAVISAAAATLSDWPDTDYGSSGSDSGFGDD